MEVGGEVETVAAMITTMGMGIAMTRPKAKAKERRESQVRTRMNANRSIRARKMDETRTMDYCDYDKDTSKAGTCIWREREDKPRCRHRVNAAPLRHYMHIGHEETQAKMRIAFGG